MKINWIEYFSGLACLCLLALVGWFVLNAAGGDVGSMVSELVLKEAR